MLPLILILVAPVVVASPIGGLPPVAGASLVASPVVRAGVVLPGVVKAGPPSHVVVGFVVELVPGVASSSAHVVLGLGEGEAGFDYVVALDDDVDLGRGWGTRLLEGCQFLQALSLSLRMKLDLSVLDWSAE